MRRYAPGSNTTYTDQVRTFVYHGTDLVSATNPETGTVTYQYNGSHKLSKKTDAQGWETRYSYDGYLRVTQVQHWALTGSQLNLSEIPDERIDYYYDTNPCGDGSFTPQNIWGRLAAVSFPLNGYSGQCVY